MGDLVETRQNELKTKKICRFCLTQNASELTSIYSRNNPNKSAPLPLQVMACVSIEVFSNDCMPSFVCSNCRLMFDYCYRFKQMCKKADTCLRHYPLTGQWSEALEHPKIPIEFYQPPRRIVQKNLNALQIPSANDEDPEIIPKFMVADKDNMTTMVVVEDNLKEEKNPEPIPQQEKAPRKIIAKPKQQVVKTPVQPNKQVYKIEPLNKSAPVKKILNKSAIRILNKEAHQTIEPLMSKPVLKRDDEGNIAIVTQILELEDKNANVDPVTNAEVIETNVFPCPHCERSFPLRQLLDIHMVNHNRERSFTCEYCEKCFFSKYDLQKHNLTHTGEKPFKCVVCEKGFTRSTLLHRHEKSHIDIPKFICVFCEKPFISQEEMEKHTERHRKHRPFICKICNKAFAFKQGLERHEVVHCRFQPFQCQYCTQSFSTPSKLSRHLTAHAGERPYPCKLCPKAYLLSHHLTRHMRSHKNGTGSYKCNECDKTFSTRDTLIYHSAVHATQTLVCPLCKDPFDDIETVTEHVKQHAEGEAFACVFCDLIYMTSERLEEHIDADHAADMVAYNEDAEANPNQPKKAEASNQNKNSNEASKEFDEVIEEFLFEEFPEEKQQIEKPSTIIVKDEIEWQKELDEDDVPTEDISIEESVESMNVVESSEAADEPPIKVRKINEKSKEITKKVATPVLNPGRRKGFWWESRGEPTEVASPNNSDSLSPKENKKPIKATPKAESISSSVKNFVAAKTRQPTIQDALKTIPKSVSVKRIETVVPKTEVVTEAPSTNQKITKQKEQTVEKKVAPKVNTQVAPKVAMTSPPQAAAKVTRQSPNVPNTRMLRQRAEVSPDTKPQPKPSTSSVVLKKPVPPKTELADVKKSPEMVAEKEKKVVEMMIGDKKVKVQRITMTKAQVAEMTRDGRIQMKEGTMILKKSRNQLIKDAKPLE